MMPRRGLDVAHLVVGGGRSLIQRQFGSSPPPQAIVFVAGYVVGGVLLGDKIAGLTLKQAKELSDYLKEEYKIEPAAGGSEIVTAPAGVLIRGHWATLPVRASPSWKPAVRISSCQ